MSRDFADGPVVKTPASTAGGTGSVPGWGTEITHAMQHGQKRKKKKCILSLFSKGAINVWVLCLKKV